MPSKVSETYAESYQSVSGYPVLVISQYIDEILVNNVDLTKRWTNTYAGDCEIVSYQITRVEDSVNEADVELDVANTLFEISSGGVFRIKNFKDIYDNYQVYIKAVNVNGVESDPTLRYVVDITMMPPIFTPPNIEPFFDTELIDLDLEIDITTRKVISATGDNEIDPDA